MCKKRVGYLYGASVVVNNRTVCAFSQCTVESQQIGSVPPSLSYPLTVPDGTESPTANRSSSSNMLLEKPVLRPVRNRNRAWSSCWIQCSFLDLRSTMQPPSPLSCCLTLGGFMVIRSVVCLSKGCVLRWLLPLLLLQLRILVIVFWGCRAFCLDTVCSYENIHICI